MNNDVFFFFFINNNLFSITEEQQRTETNQTNFLPNFEYLLLLSIATALDKAC